MKKLLLVIILLIIVAAAVWAAIFGLKYLKPASPSQGQDQSQLGQEQEGIEFDKCLAAGKTPTASYPRKCTVDGKTYAENIGNAVAKKDLVQATQPKPGSVITSPTTVMGQARGTWFFEGQFPVVLLDSNNNELGRGAAKAFADWTTTNFVPFEASFEFSIPSTETGTLLLKKDNPSGDPAKDDQLEIPIRFVPIKINPTSSK